MYGIITVIPRLYTVHGGDDPSSNENDITKMDNFDGSLEYKIKIKYDLVPLFRNCENYHSIDREKMIDTLINNLPKFKEWYDKIIFAGRGFTGSVGWYGRSRFFIGIRLEIIFDEDDAEYLE